MTSRPSSSRSVTSHRDVGAASQHSSHRSSHLEDDRSVRMGANDETLSEVWITLSLSG